MSFAFFLQKSFSTERMARQRSKVSKAASRQSMPSDDEVDDFHNNQEKVMLERAGSYARAQEEEEDEEEEVMGLDEEDDDEEEEEEEEEDEEDEDEEEEGDEEEREEGWGGRKNYYGGDEVDDAEAAKQMAEEAIRQQKKNLKELGIDDYYDEDMMEDWEQKAESFDTQSTSKVNLVINDENNDLEKLDRSEKMELLSQSFPEFVPLLKELNELNIRMASFEEEEDNEVIKVKKSALSAYLGSISSYFSLFIDQVKSGEPFSSMKQHPVMETILTARQIWKEADKLAIADDSDSEVFMDAEEYQDEDMEQAEELSGSESEVSQLESESESESESDDDLDIDINKKRQIKGSASKPVGDFIETDTLDDVDAEDKQRRKKSLRFYTSKIDQAQAKNDEKFAGDLDLPYKERLFERKQRLIEEARKRGQSDSLGADLDDQDFGSEDEKLANDINEEDDNYYQNLRQTKQHKKDARKVAHKEATKLAREGKLAEGRELVGDDGKRALNFQIMKNKGLTAKKRKEVRNARVKKRKKYEDAKKKLKSVRQVYDADNRGPYEGEKTGIKKGLSRSVKLV